MSTASVRGALHNARTPLVDCFRILLSHSTGVVIGRSSEVRDGPSEWSIHCGSNDPIIIATVAIKNPTSCGGHTGSEEPDSSNIIHVPSPVAMASNAPCVVARLQYNPANNGTKAATSVTL